MNSRVADKDGNRGSVRYVGPVATSKTLDAVYYGIEWDDTTRGKGDGSVVLPSGEVVRYFTCKQAHGTASFLKEELVQKGVDFMAALVDKYSDTSTAGGGAIAGLTGKAVPVLLVGDEKIR